MKLFEMFDTGGLLLSLRNYRDQANTHQNSLSLKFDAFKRQFNLDDYGLSDPESFKQWVEKTDGAESVIDTVGIQDINDPNPTVLFKTTSPGEVPDQPESNPQSPTVAKMASRAAKQALGKKP
jgi:hypothetical protein